MNPRNYIFVDALQDALETVTGINGGPGGLLIDGTFLFLDPPDGSSSATCDMLCALGCETQVYKIKFINPETACSTCNRSAGFQMTLTRDPEFDNQSYLSLPLNLEFRYPFLPSTGTITAAQIATWAVAQVNAVEWPTGTDHYGITAIIDASDGTGETVLFTMPSGCDQFVVGNVVNATQNTVTLVSAGIDAVVPATWAAEFWPLQQGISTIPGAPAPASWQGCKNPCILHLRGCISYCAGQDIPNWNQNLTASLQDVFIVFNNDTTDFADAEVALLVENCSGLCRFNAYASASGCVAGTVNVIINATTFPVTYSATDTLETFLVKVNAAIQPTWPNVVYYAEYAAGAYRVHVKFGIDGGDNPPTILSIGGVAFTSQSVEGGGNCGCLFAMPGAYPFTGLLKVNATEFVTFTAVASAAAYLTALQAKVPAAVRWTAAGAMIYFPYDAVTSSGAAVVCSEVGYVATL